MEKAVRQSEPKPSNMSLYEHIRDDPTKLIKKGLKKVREEYTARDIVSLVDYLSEYMISFPRNKEAYEIIRTTLEERKSITEEMFGEDYAVLSTYDFLTRETTPQSFLQSLIGKNKAEEIFKKTNSRDKTHSKEISRMIKKYLY